jgi:hypothetical protein
MKTFIRILVLAAAVAGAFALAGPAFASDAHMSEVWDGQKMRGKVIYDAGNGEVNDVTISMLSPTKLVIRDPGAYIWAKWGAFMGYGCHGWSGGTTPAVCEHPNGFAIVEANLGDGDDSLEIAPSVSSSVASIVDSDLLWISRGGCPLCQALSTDFNGNDHIDVRGGAAGDDVTCGDGSDVVVGDPGDLTSGCEVRWFGEEMNFSQPLGSGPAVSSWGSGRLDVFWREAPNFLGADTLMHKWFDGGWEGPESLGGQLTSDPAAVSWGPGRIDVFYRGPDGSLHHKWYDQAHGGWLGPESLGGQLASGSSPAVASSGPGKLEVFWRGTGNDLRWRWYAGGWGPEQSLGGALTSDPAAVSWGPGRLDVFYRGTNNDLRHKWDDGGVGGWRPDESLGGVLTSGPGVASRGADKLDVFVFGTDNALYRKSFDAGWSDWERLGGRTRRAASDPEAVSWGSGRLDIFMRATDNALRHMWLP